MPDLNTHFILWILPYNGNLVGEIDTFRKTHGATIEIVNRWALKYKIGQHTIVYFRLCR